MSGIWACYHCDDDTAEKIFEENYAYKSEKYNTVSVKKNNDDIAEQVFEETNPFKDNEINNAEIKLVKDEQRQENSHWLRASAILTVILIVLYFVIPKTEQFLRIRAFSNFFMVIFACFTAYFAVMSVMLRNSTNKNNK